VSELIDVVLPPSGRSLYEADEHEWIGRQIEALKTGQFEQVDCENLVAYLTEMTVRDRRELKSRLRVLLQHLLKIRMQPEKISRSWLRTITEQQDEIQSIIEDIPSLGKQTAVFLAEIYPKAVKRAAQETKISADKFPGRSPWTVEQALAFEPPSMDDPKL
jgi:hypothetical protein